MGEIFENLIFQFYIILLVPFLYHSLWKENIRNKFKINEFFLAFICSISVVLSMVFAIQVHHGHYFDLRIVPLIYIVWYANLFPSMIVLVVLLITRFFIGGTGLFIAIIVTLFVYLFTIYIKPKYQCVTFVKKIQMAVAIILSYSIIKIVLTDLVVPGGVDELISFPFLLLYTLTIIVSTYVLIYILETFKQREKFIIERQKDEKRKMVNQLAASVAHEVFSPLTSIKGFLQMTKASLKEKQNLKEAQYVDFALSETNKVESIVKDYLSLANPVMNLDETIDINFQLKLLENEIVIYSRDKEVKCYFSIEGHLKTIGNKERLRLVLRKILNNAIEASTPGSTVSCECSKENHNIVILISDQGIGMSKEKIEQIGLPFYTLKEKGTGLSLMICYRIIELMKGTITITSEENVGTDVRIILPLV